MNDRYFEYDLEKKEVSCLQSAVIRTNCIDCLDRTNVVQSVFAKSMLFRELFGNEGEMIKKECLFVPCVCE